MPATACLRHSAHCCPSCRHRACGLGPRVYETHPPMPVDVTLDRVHHLQCLRNTPLAGTNANRHSDFVFAWAMLGRYVHELAWSRPEPQIAFGSSPVGQVKGVKTWGQGPYEQGFLPLLLGYGSSQTRMAILPGPDLFMANRFAEAVPPPVCSWIRCQREKCFAALAPDAHPARGHLGQR